MEQDTAECLAALQRENTALQREHAALQREHALLKRQLTVVRQIDDVEFDRLYAKISGPFLISPLCPPTCLNVSILFALSLFSHSDAFDN